MTYIHFDVRGQRHLTHKTTIMKFPDSLFIKLIEENTCYSKNDPIRIDRDSKHFETILNLMRTQNPAYASTIPGYELDELLKELTYYNLSILSSLVSKLIVHPPLMAPHSTWILSNDEKYLSMEKMIRPTLVVPQTTIENLTFLDENFQIDALIRAFDHRCYDIAIASNYTRLFGLTFYMPADGAVLAICDDYASGLEFVDKLNKTLILLDWYMKDRERAHQLKSEYMGLKFSISTS